VTDDAANGCGLVFLYVLGLLTGIVLTLIVASLTS